MLFLEHALWAAHVVPAAPVGNMRVTLCVAIKGYKINVCVLDRVLMVQTLLKLQGKCCVQMQNNTCVPEYC